MKRAVIQRDELVGAMLDFGSVAIDLSEYATTGLRTVTVGPSGIGKTNAGLLIAEQLAEQGWICVLVDPDGEIESMYGDAVGGITASEAGREIGAYLIVFQAIKGKTLPARRVGRLWVIPHAAWKAWKAKRTFPPKGYVQLSRIKRPLGIRSDKLSEWARTGYVPTAIRCNPYGTRAKSTKFGSWYIDPKVARKLVADRRAGRPMPWWGKPDPGNLAVTWKLLQKRRHPASCTTCAHIWGRKGAPITYADYAERYPPLAHGAKRHLTRKWSPGLTIEQVAKYTARSWSAVRIAIDNGTLTATRTGRSFYVSKTAATHWKARRCPLGGGRGSWISLSAAALQHQFTLSELRQFVEIGKLRSKLGTNGPMRGITYVPRHQVRQLRESIGFTQGQAARRAGISIARLRLLLKGVDWRGGDRIPLDTVNAVIKRIESRAGYSIEEAAAKLRTSVQWIHERKIDGTIRIARAKWDQRRLYITAPMFERLQEARRNPVKREQFTADWLFLSEAAKEAGVSTGTLIAWADAGDVESRPSHIGRRYRRKSVRARARRYWSTVRFRRALPPDWLQERGAA